MGIFDSMGQHLHGRQNVPSHKQKEKRREQCQQKGPQSSTVKQGKLT